MDLDSNTIEHLRQRYRKEAQIAIEEARSRAVAEVTESYNHKVKLLEDEIRQWKAVAEALSSDENGDDVKQTSLVKYIMENVYRDMKREYSDGSEASQQAMSTMKRALVSTTEKMLQKLPNLVLRLESPSNTAKQITVDSRAAGGNGTMHRPRCLQISSAACTPPRLISLVHVAIDEISGAGVFSKGYTSYMVEVQAVLANETAKASMRHPRSPCSAPTSATNTTDQATVLKFIQRKRYSDFCNFHAQLDRRFPLSILPPLPPKSPAAAVAEKRQGESIPEMRQRLLRMWLQYVLLHSTYHPFPATREFVTGISVSNASSRRDALGGWEVDTNGGPAAGPSSSKHQSGADTWSPAAAACAAGKQESGFSDEYEDEVYDSFLEADGPVRTGRLSSDPHAGDTLSAPIKYKCQQDRHSVTRDYEQLKPNVKSALEACKNLIETMRSTALVRTKLANSLSLLSDYEDCPAEKAALQEVKMGMERTLPLMQSILASLSESIKEPMYFLNVEVMEVAGSVLSDVNKVSSKDPKLYLEAHRSLLREWSVFRMIRHDTLTRHLCEAASVMAAEHERIARHWCISVGEIQQLVITSMTLSGTVSRGWRALVEREREELNEIISSLNEAHDQRKQMQQLFAESSVYLQNDKRTTATAQRPTTSLMGGSKPTTSNAAPLRHKVASRPVIPVGTRREPGERVFYGDAIVNAVEETLPPNTVTPILACADTSSDSFVDINVHESDNMPSARISDSPPSAAAVSTHTLSTPSSSPPESTPDTDVAESPSSSAKKTSSSSSSGWSTFFWGKSKSGSKESKTTPTTTAPSPVKPPPASKSSSSSSSTKPLPVPAAPSSRAENVVAGTEGDDSDEQLEDTPMNRAYLERKERERKLAEEEEERILRARTKGGGVSTGDELLDEWLAGGGDKRGAVARRRPAPSGTSQRRPKPQTRPHGTSSNTSADIPVDRNSGSGPSSSGTTPTMPSHMPSQSPARSSAPGPMSSSYQDHSALFHAAAAQSAARNRPLHSEHVDTPPMPTAAPPAGGSKRTNATSGTDFGGRSSSVDSARSSDYSRPQTAFTSSVSAPLERSRSVSNAETAESMSCGAEGTEPALPAGWEEVVPDEGGRYFYHKVTRVSRWDRPTAEVAAAVENRLHSSQKQVEESLERKRREREKLKAKEEEENAIADQLQGKIRQTLVNWRTPPGSAKERPLPELLSSLHLLLGSDLCPPQAIVSAPLTLSAAPGEVKKAYLKAVRIVHPDKIGAQVDLEKKLLAEEAFILLSQLYEIYRKAHNL